MPASKVQLTGGNFQDAEGNVLALGYLTMHLSQDEEANSSLVCAGIEIKITLDANGNVSAGQSVWGNDQLLPDNSYYKVTGYTAAGQPAWGPNNQQVLGNGGTFDTGSWIPNQIVSWVPPATLQGPQGIQGIPGTQGIQGAPGTNGASIDLQVNGTDTASQTKLNLYAGTGISITDAGAGRVNIINTVTSPILRATLTMTPAQIRAANTTRVTLVPGVAGKVINFLSITAVLGPRTLYWGALGLQYNIDSSGGWLSLGSSNWTCGPAGAAPGTYFALTVAATFSQQSNNDMTGYPLAVYIGDSGDATADGSITWTVLYTLI